VHHLTLTTKNSFCAYLYSGKILTMGTFFLPSHKALVTNPGLKNPGHQEDARGSSISFGLLGIYTSFQAQECNLKGMVSFIHHLLFPYLLSIFVNSQNSAPSNGLKILCSILLLLNHKDKLCALQFLFF